MISPQLPVSNIIFDGADELSLETAKDKALFRNYVDTPLHDRVSNTYRKQHTFQTYDYVVAKKEQYGKLNTGLELSIWDAAEMLNDIID